MEADGLSRSSGRARKKSAKLMESELDGVPDVDLLKTKKKASKPASLKSPPSTPSSLKSPPSKPPRDSETPPPKAAKTPPPKAAKTPSKSKSSKPALVIKFKKKITPKSHLPETSKPSKTTTPKAAAKTKAAKPSTAAKSSSAAKPAAAKSSTAAKPSSAAKPAAAKSSVTTKTATPKAVPSAKKIKLASAPQVNREPSNIPAPAPVPLPSAITVPKLKVSLTGTPHVSTVQGSDSEEEGLTIHFDEGLPENNLPVPPLPQAGDDSRTSFGDAEDDSNDDEDMDPEEIIDEELEDLSDVELEDMGDLELEDDSVHIDDEDIDISGRSESMRSPNSSKRKRKLPAKLAEDYCDLDAFFPRRSGNRAAQFFENRKKENRVRAKLDKEASSSAKKKRVRMPTSYTMWCNSYRPKLMSQFPDLDFAATNRKLGEIWTSMPLKDKKRWKVRASRIAKFGMPKNSKMSQYLGTKGLQLVERIHPEPMPKKGGGKAVTSQVAPPFPHTAPHFLPKPDAELQKMDIEPMDIASRFVLMGEGLLDMAKSIKDGTDKSSTTERLDNIMDMMLSGVCGLMCLTQQIPQVAQMIDDQELFQKTIANTNYYMPTV